MRFKRILVTGGAGFIGSAFIRYGLENLLLDKIVNVDLLTYAGHEKNMEDFLDNSRHMFIRGNICDSVLIKKLCQEYSLEAIVHFAAESHVDRSIQDPTSFLETNVYGTFALLEVVRQLPHLHFHHVSTDEVYGSLENGFFNEHSSYRPNSPYAASKAASDHFVRAWGHTYGLSTTISHCT
jgi:dTDP-glucose 4,6-dehydratase